MMLHRKYVYWHNMSDIKDEADFFLLVLFESYIVNTFCKNILGFSLYTQEKILKFKNLLEFL